MPVFLVSEKVLESISQSNIATALLLRLGNCALEQTLFVAAHATTSRYIFLMDQCVQLLLEVSVQRLHALVVTLYLLIALPELAPQCVQGLPFFFNKLTSLALEGRFLIVGNRV